MKHEKNNVKPNMEAIEEVLASKGITKDYLERHSGITKYIFNKLMAGRNVTMDTATKICHNLGKEFKDLFIISLGKNQTSYATLSIYDTAENKPDDDEFEIKKPERSQNITEQYTCQLCGHMSQKHVNVRGKYMCAKCAAVSRCHVCFRVTNVLYIKNGMEICPKCDQRIETEYMPYEGDKTE